FINLFQATDLKIQFLGAEEYEGKKLDVILISDPAGNELKIYVDQTTYLPVKQTYRGSGMTGPATMEEIFSDFRDVSGVKLPFHQLTNSDGQKFAESKVLEVNINPEVDPNLFVKK
ncbi:MAG: hypothetical protein Q8N71_06340, partial [candidate division Zixibacteria bacterium]|nr:hypothetical protein [candidate division Zixibacteria bacterium]